MNTITPAMLSAPVVLYYTEGSETYAVNAAGLIGRPSIGMAPSGGWRLTGIATRYGSRLADFPQMVAALLNGTEFPNKSAACLTDWDHGSHRVHGSPALKRVWLAADHGMSGPELVELVDSFQAVRLELERQRATAANDARRAAAEAQEPRGYYGPPTNPLVTLYRFRRPSDGYAFALVYRDGRATDPLRYSEAAEAVGRVLLEEWDA